MQIERYEADRTALLPLFALADDSPAQVATYISLGELLTHKSEGRSVGFRAGAVGLLSLIPVVLILSASTHGLGVSPDSVGYVAAARTFDATGQFLYWDGSPYVLWPPGLPLLLGLVSRFGIDLQVTAIILNCVAAFATVTLSYVLARAFVRSWLVALVPAALVATELPTLEVDQMLWSEPLFSALILGSLCLMVRIHRPGVRPAEFVLLVCLISMASATRFLGVALVPLAAGTVGLAALGNGRVRAFTHAILMGALSSAGLLAAVARNLSLGANAFGPRSASTYSIHAAVVDTASTIGRFVDPFAQERAAVIVGLVVVGLAATGAVVMIRGRIVDGAPGYLLPLFIGLYLVLLVASELTTNINGVNTRYLAPIVAPLAVLVVVGGGAISRGLPGWRYSSSIRVAGSQLIRTGLVAALLAFGLLNVDGDLRDVHAAAESGVGYNAVAILGSPLAAAVRGLPQAARIVSNDPIEVYWVSARFPVIGAAAFGAPAEIDQLRAQLSTGAPIYFVGFSQTATVQGVSADDLGRAGFQLSQLATYSDGILYSVGLGDQ